MKPSQLVHAAEYNSRKYEGALRDAEHKVAFAHEHGLRLQVEITECLERFAALQVGHGPLKSNKVVELIKQREGAERGLRNDLSLTEKEVVQTMDDIDEQNAQLETINEKAHQALSQNAEYVHLHRNLEATEKDIASHEFGYQEILKECQSKLSSFRESKPHCYLNESGYGTDQYKAGKLIRFLDNWLAYKINYRANRESELILISMQEANLAGNTRRLVTLSDNKASIANMLANALAEAGAKAVEAELSTLHKRVASLKQKANNLHKEIDQFVAKHDRYFKQASRLIADQLHDKPISELMEIALASQDKDDDELIRQLAELRTSLAAHTESVPAYRQQVVAATRDYERAKTFERSLRSLRTSDYEYRYRSTLNIDYLLNGYMTGAISLEHIESSVRAARLEIQKSSDSGFGSGGFGSSSSSGGGGFSSSASSGGGGFSSSASSGGGGFSTSDSL